MAETFRRSKIEKFIKRLEAKLPALSSAKREVVKEIVADLKHEFKLGEEMK